MTWFFYDFRLNIWMIEFSMSIKNADNNHLPFFLLKRFFIEKINVYKGKTNVFMGTNNKCQLKQGKKVYKKGKFTTKVFLVNYCTISSDFFLSTIFFEKGKGIEHLGFASTYDKYQTLERHKKHQFYLVPRAGCNQLPRWEV